MATYTLKWSPAISGTTIKDWEGWMKHGHFSQANGCVWDVENVHYGDEFYMVAMA